MKKLTLVLATILMMTLLISGCAGNNELAMHSADKSASTEPGSPQEASGELANSAGFMSQTDDSDVDKAIEEERDLAGQTGNKIIQSGYMALETLNFDESTNAIKRKVDQSGGFVAQSNIDGTSKYSDTKRMRTAYFKLRIPKDKLEMFMTDVGDLGDVTHSEVHGEDVSAEYYDTEARLETLKVQEDRLLAILSEAEKLTDIIELERELSSVRYEIESLTGSLRKWDNLVEFSTLDIEVYEVEEYKEDEVEPKSLWEKIVKGFNNSLKNVVELAEAILVFLISAIPFVVLFSIIGVVVYFIVKFILKIVKK